MGTKRLFISTVSNEFKNCRMRLSDDLRSPGVVVENQEEYIQKIPSGHSMLIKLDDYIKDCHALIHLIGQQTSKDGRAAHNEAVDDILRRYPDLPGITGLAEAELRSLSYTQWEAWLAYYHIKTKRPDLKLLIATPTAAFTPDNPPDSATARDQELSQAWHEKQLRTRARYVEARFSDEKDLSIAVFKLLKDILPAHAEQHIVRSRLFSRHTGPESIGEFLGREDELKLLNEAWDTPGTNVLSIIAWGGVGKTALLAEWIDRRFVQAAWKNDVGQPDPIFYFDWTFYDQGTRSDDASHAGSASVGSFFEAALRFFGDTDPTLPGKGGRLAGLIQKHRTLLVLDGLEPMQYPPNHPQAGQITDPDLHALLATLAQKNLGLCVLTSRQALTGIRRVDRHDLDELPEAIAIRLLQKLGVIGTEADLAAAVRDYFGHALSLIVLGRFLFVKGGDIRLRDTIKLERANERRPETTTRNAWHVLEAYEQWLASTDGRTEDVQALRLTGLFDRPASPDCLDALRRAPAIPGLTDHLVPLDDDAWNAVLHRLHEAHLIQLRYPPRESNSLAPRPEPSQVPLDAHPLIREYFATQLRNRQPKAFEAAHSRLFDHLCQNTEHQPYTVAGLQPLYQAVVHGCLAGRQQEALEKVYLERIERGDDSYSSYKLGAISSNLAAVGSFFESPWSELSPNLSELRKGFLFNEACFLLWGSGRLTEAHQPIQRAIDIAERLQQWDVAASRAYNLCLLSLDLGWLNDAVAQGQRCVEFAYRDPSIEERIECRAALAEALLAKGQRAEAKTLFEEAERLQQKELPDMPMLRSAEGFGYCKLILAEAERRAWSRILSWNTSSQNFDAFNMNDEPFEAHRLAELQGACDAAAQRALYGITVPKQSLRDCALDNLTFARAKIYSSVMNWPENGSQILQDEISHHLHESNSKMLESGNESYSPEILLAAALFDALSDKGDKAKKQMDEAQEIAERGPMPLYLADVHLHRARLFHDKIELHRARALIEKHSYWRRKEELEDAEAAAVNW